MGEHSYIGLFPRVLIVLYRDKEFWPSEALLNRDRTRRLRLIPFTVILRRRMSIMSRGIGIHSFTNWVCARINAQSFRWFTQKRNCSDDGRFASCRSITWFFLFSCS